MLKKILVLVSLVLLLGVSAKAAPITVVNPGFELDGAGNPQTTKQFYHSPPGSVLGWDNVNPTPVSNEVGVEKHNKITYPLNLIGYGGDWRMFNFYTDSAKQTTGHTIVAGERYTLGTWAYSLFGAKYAVVSWYVDDGANQTIIDTQKVGLLHTPFYTYKGSGTFGDWQNIVVTSPFMTAAEAGDKIGVILGCENLIGWEWNSAWYASAWAVFDDVQITAVPEPMTIALLGLGGLLLRRRK